MLNLVIPADIYITHIHKQKRISFSVNLINISIIVRQTVFSMDRFPKYFIHTFVISVYQQFAFKNNTSRNCMRLKIIV